MRTNPPIRIAWPDDRPPAELDPAEIERALATFLTELGHGGRGLSVLMADDATLRELNRTYRQRNRPTDVLSWSYLETGGEGELLGDLALSLDRARAQAAENGWDLRTEMLRLLAHGCAHLAGHDHADAAGEREMRRVEERLLAAVGLEGLYPPEAG